MRDTHNEARLIARLLDSGLEHIDAKPLEVLRTAREQALRRQRHQPRFWPSFDALSLRWPFVAHHPHLMAGLPLVLVLTFGTFSFWQHAQTQDVSHIDVAILTDAMPMEVFVDLNH